MIGILNIRATMRRGTDPNPGPDCQPRQRGNRQFYKRNAEDAWQAPTMRGAIRRRADSYRRHRRQRTAAARREADRAAPQSAAGAAETTALRPVSSGKRKLT